MTTNTAAFFIFPGIGGKEGGTGFSPGVASGMYPESQPSGIWGQGTPDGDRSPFVNLNKGSLYMAVNNTDDEPCLYCKVDEGGDDADWVRILHDKMGLDHGASSATDCTIDWDIDVTLSSGDSYAGLDVRLTMDGSAATWASAVYFAATQPTTKAVNGYLSVLELELTSGCNSSSAMFPLVINFSDNGTSNLNAQRAFIALREYGSAAPPALLWLGQEFQAAEGSSSNTVMWTSTGASYEANVDHAIRFIVGTANEAMWIPVCSVGPAG